MTTPTDRGRIAETGQVFIRDTHFWLHESPGKVQRFVGAQLPPKVTLGDYSQDSNPITSTWLAVNDPRGGIGIDRMDISTDLNRCWFSRCDLRHKGHLVLPPTITTAGTWPGTVNTIQLGELANVIYATTGTSVLPFDGSDWDASVRTLAAAATDIKTGMLDGTETLVIAQSSDVDWFPAGGSWSRDTTDIKYLQFHNDLLWGISNTGQLYFTDNLTNGWTEDALLKLPAGYVTNLIEGNRPDGERALYAATKVGLYVHDSANARFVKTDLAVPFHPDGGRGCCEWRGSIYYSAGLAIYRYIPGNPGIVTIVGPDRDDGLPAARQGVVLHLVGSHNELFAAVGQSAGSSAPASAAGLILGWDERGWQVVATVLKETPSMIVSGAHSKYRLWVAIYLALGPSVNVRYIDLDIGIVNPTQITSRAYLGGGVTHETPWFDAGVAHQMKTALQAVLETTNPTSDETVKLEYATNYVETFTTMGTQTETGETAYAFKTDGLPVGLEFRSIKFMLTLTRGATTTNTPDVPKLALVYMRTLEDLKAFGVRLDLTRECKGRKPKELRERLEEILSTRTLMDFSYRDEADNTENHYVVVRAYQSLDETGHSNATTYELTLSEAVSEAG